MDLCSWGCPGCSVLGRTHRKAGPPGRGLAGCNCRTVWSEPPGGAPGFNRSYSSNGLEMEFQEFGEEMVGKNMSMDIFFVRFFVRKQKRQVGSML